MVPYLGTKMNLHINIWEKPWDIYRREYKYIELEMAISWRIH